MVIRRVRSGASKLGCLLMLIAVGATGYFGVSTGKHFLKYYQFKDAMQSQARFAAHRTDDAISLRLKALVDTLGLPMSAKNIRVKRANGVIFIWTEYYVHVEFPGFIKELNFAPSAQAPF